MGRNAARRRAERNNRAVLDGSVYEAVRFAREHRREMVEAVMARWTHLSLASAESFVERLLSPTRQKIGLGERAKSLLLGLVTLIAGRAKP